ncbi:radical SAM protein [Streptantibioticus cattleyicolor]|uniref:Radical SAM protein n=1 Tax=Streptantibioticus cattleyicolor (strain ATCC 35852 / DSM 46488 / JCM 4925 / NBRC 14057 / NRRL 8057) TaxID=1003195 RepID=F8JJ55_STREN
MYQAIASPQGDKFIVARPGARKGMHIPHIMYKELSDAVADRQTVPGWLVDAARQAWGIDLAGCPTERTVLVRPLTSLNYSRATWEINKGCNFNCEHRYLAERKFEGLSREEKDRLLFMLRDAGVLWLQFTGGEPTIDRDFAHSYRTAYGLGMLIKAAKEAGVPLELALIVTKHNAHEVEAMRDLAEEYAYTYTEYANISPTYDGKPEPLAAQAPGFLDKSTVFKGCPAGHAFFHVDPHGFATMCKVGRENPVNLMAEGLDGLLRLPAIADAEMLRSGGCSGCRLSATCRVCRPLAKAYQEAKAPLNTYCQHGNGDHIT